MGQPIAIWGVPWNDIPQKDLRPLAQRLGITRYGKMKKHKQVAALIKAYNKKDIYAPPATKNPRKTPNCPFRLLNICFHTDFKADFGTIGNAPT